MDLSPSPFWIKKQTLVFEFNNVNNDIYCADSDDTSEVLIGKLNLNLNYWFE